MTHDLKRPDQSTRTSRRRMLRWLPTFFGFPIGGYAAYLIVGPVDGVAVAIAGGAISGIGLGAVQSWGLGSVGPAARRWITATAIGFTAGLGIGSAVVDYGTRAGDLMTQGAICGVAVGAAQAVVLRERLGPIAFAWVPTLGALWAAGWGITNAAGIDVDKQFTVFGSSGALAVAAATSVLPVLLANRSERSAS